MKPRIPLVILAVALAAGALYWFKTRTRADTVTTELHGNVDIREVNLGFRVGGRIQEIAVEEGDVVKQGQKIAVLDSEPYQREVQEAGAQVAALQARLDLLQSGYRPQEIAQARAIVAEREVTRENAERLARRQKELVAAKAVSQQDFEDAEARLREAEARLKSAREQLALLEAGFRAEEVSQAQAELARAQAGLAGAQLRLQDTELMAPADGVVLTRAHEPGAIVQSGATVLTLSLQNPVWVRAYINEPNLGRIFPGMPVEIISDGRPDQPYRGQIGYISPRAEFTPKNVETPELRTSLVYRLRVVVDNADQGLRQGMPVTIKLRLNSTESARTPANP